MKKLLKQLITFFWAHINLGINSEVNAKVSIFVTVLTVYLIGGQLE